LWLNAKIKKGLIMTKTELDAILKKHTLWLQDKKGGEMANLRFADLHSVNLRSANLSFADLCFADLRSANLRFADLHCANLSSVNLRSANLSSANLSFANLSFTNIRSANLSSANLISANLRFANLHSADLRSANLSSADLRSADFDYSCWPLWCGSNNVKVDKRIAAQLAAHFCALDCTDKDYLKAKADILEFAKMSHRAQDLNLSNSKESHLSCSISY